MSAYVTTAEIGAALGLSARHARRLVLAGVIPGMIERLDDRAHVRVRREVWLAFRAAAACPSCGRSCGCAPADKRDNADTVSASRARR